MEKNNNEQDKSQGNIETVSNKDKSFYLSNKSSSMPDDYDGPKAFDGIKRASASSSFFEITNDTVTTRTPFNRSDYNYYRPGEKTPTKFKNVVKACRFIYETNGVVRNVVNLMVDFTVEDLQIIHPDPEIEIFYKAWAKKAMVPDIVEEMARHLLIDGNSVLKRLTGKISKPVEKEFLKASPDVPPLKTDKNKPQSREIPLRYLFLDILNLSWKQDEFEKMVGSKKLCIELNNKFVQQVKEAMKSHPEMVSQLPADIRKHILSNQNINKSNVEIPLDMSKLFVCHYKKDSWDNWATPYLSGVIENIQFKDKLRLADRAALDGVINVIRLWKLGDHTEGIYPNAAVIERLHEVLETNTGGGAMDIVWDSMISMEEYYPPVEKILGPEKYTQVNRDILFSLGIPEVLLGGQGANFSNSWIQLKTIIEKLQYIRSKIISWLQDEVKMVASAMSFDQPALVKFKKMNLQDENITKKLIVGLLDRGVISTEAVLEAYDEDFPIQVEKIKRQNKVLEEAGIEIKSPFDQKEEIDDGGNGRPPDSTEDNNRKDRQAKPRTASGFNINSQARAMDILDILENTVIRDVMEDYGVSNARKLNADQKKKIDEIRMSALSCFSMNDNVTKDLVYIKCTDIKNFNDKMVYEYNKALDKFRIDNGDSPTIMQSKMIKANIWSKYN